MDMIGREHTLDDLHAKLVTDLPDDLAKSFAHLTAQHFEPVLGHPNDVKAVVKFGMASSTIGHDHSR